MNIIKKKQPHKVAIIADYGAKTALKMAFIPSNLKQSYNSCKVELFLNSNWASWASLMGYDAVKTFKTTLTLKLQLLMSRPDLIIDLRDTAHLKQFSKEIKLNYKFKIDAFEYLKAQEEIVSQGLGNYVCFYNGYTFFEDRPFGNKKWPFESEFINLLLKEGNKKIVYFFDNKKPFIHGPGLDFVDINKISKVKLITYLEKAKGFYGTDTFLSLLSAVIGTPTVILQGPTRESNIGLKNVKLLEASVPCSPCHTNFDCKDNVCMKVFTPKEIMQNLS